MPSTHKCPQCGGLFQVFGDQWGYDYGGTRVCSYHCMRDMRKKDLEGETMKGKPMTAEQLSAMYEFWKQKHTRDAIADLAGVSKTTAGRYVALFNKGYTPYGKLQKAPEPEKLPEPEQLPEPMEAPEVPEAPEAVPEIRAAKARATGRNIDRARIISMLCDIAEQLIAILREDVG